MNEYAEILTAIFEALNKANELSIERNEIERAKLEQLELLSSCIGDDGQLSIII